MATKNSNIDLPESFLLREKKKQKNGKRFLRFALQENMTGLVLLEDLKRTIEVKVTEILPVPEVPKYWMGISNWQGEAIWILDLIQILGGQSYLQRESLVLTGMAMLIRVEQQTIGLLIERVKGIEIYDSNEFIPIAEVNPNADSKSFFKGHFVNSDREPSMLLDIKSLILMLQKNN